MKISHLANQSRREGGLGAALPRRVTWLLGFLLAAFSLPAMAFTGTSNYVYDDLGRLIQVIASDGSSVQYAYDAAGNLIGIKNNAVNTVSVAGFTPNIGPVGTVVTIQGSGFSTTPGANTVQFNGQSATVSAATATMLTVSVPTGATTGTLSVSNSNGSATSLATFTVGTPQAGPTLSSFTPTVVNPGGSVSVTGTGYQSSPIRNNKILVGGTIASLTSATATTITFAAPASNGGLVAVTTPYGQVASSSRLTIVPSSISPANVVQVGDLAVDGTATSISIAAGKVGIYRFDGTAGQVLGLGLSGYSSTPSGGTITSWQVLKPDGSVLATCGVYLPAAGCGAFNNFPTTLPSTGTYAVIVQADASHAMTATLTLSTMPAGTLTVDASATAVSISRIGQAPRYTFNGTAGQMLDLVWSSSTIAPGSFPGYLYVMNPDGTMRHAEVRADTAVPNGSLSMGLLTQTGTYTVMVWPPINGGSTGSINLRVKGSKGTLNLDGTPTAVSLSAGEVGRYLFEGTAGQALGLGLNGFSSTPSGGTISSWQVLKPDGTVLASCGIFLPAMGCGAFNVHPTILPSTGTYQVVLQADSTHAIAATLTLSTHPSGILTIDAAATTVTVARIGQAPRYTFFGTSGQTLSLVWANSTIPSGTYPGYLYVSTPDGAWLVNGARADTVVPNGSVSMGTLSKTGTYTVMVWPPTNAGSTGAIDIRVTSSSGSPPSYTPTGTLTVDGTPTNISLSAGQQGIYTFSGTAGDKLGLALSNYVSSPSGGTVSSWKVLTPQGTLMATCAVSLPTMGCNALNNYPTLPSTGTYQVVVQADATHALTATLTLSTMPTGSLTADAAATTVTVSRMGQAPRYTFSGSIGQTLSLVWANSTISASPAQGYIYVYKPDGSLLTSARSDSGVPNGVIVLGSLVQAGTYTAMVWPPVNGGSTGSVDLRLRSQVTGTLTTDGTPASVTLGEYQKGRYTFSGTVGQTLKVQTSSVSTTPSGASVSLVVTSPQGVTVGTCSSSNTSTLWLNCKLSTLPSTGTYAIDFNAGSSAAAFNLAISPINFAGQ